MPKMVSDFLAEARTLDREAFLLHHADPVLIRRSDEQTADPRSEYRSTLKMKIDPDTREVRVEPTPPAPMDLVIPLVKSNRNSFAGKVLVGRTETNDIVVSDLTVSKHHAFFAHDARATRHTLMDTGSTNGTQINGQALAPRVTRYLADGDQLAFGDIRFVFYTPGGFYDLLTSLSALR